LKQADNRFDLEKRRGHNGDSTDLYHLDITDRFADDTAPNSKWWDGTTSNLNIREISKFGNVMTFKEGLKGETVFTSLKKESSPNLSIPDNTVSGVSDTISFAEQATISTIKVNVDISHTYRGDLTVTLYAPTGEEIVLHDRKGGKDDDIKTTYDTVNLPGLSLLLGKAIKGEWRLHIQDLAAQDKGVLNKWGIEIEAVSDKTLVLEESPGTTIPDNNPTGIERTLSTNETGNIKSTEVSVEITHTYIQDLIVSLISPKGTKVDLHNKTGGSADNIFKTFTAATTPDLSKFNGESVQGIWKLKVSDHAGQDIGKLNKWSVKIVY
jgi:subtilisin-like proprotein convertase family protein